jgi:maltooligosyltrehalose trehalohydrolase
MTPATSQDLLRTEAARYAPGARREAPTWGPTPTADGIRFRLWAPGQHDVRLRLTGTHHPMVKDADGWFETTRPADWGADYGFVLDDGRVVPDPAARAQALDVHGPSRLVDPEAYRWESPGWRGRPWEEAAILEIHVGTFTAEGTFRAAMARLDHVAATGFTAIELMPVAQFAGSRNWGYDGVLLYAPHPAYGTPDDLRALVDAAHARGLMVILDVVYNHFGPEGNYIGSYAPSFFHEGRHTPWGVAIAYERPEVRAFFIENALYWLDEFRFDGLRLDAADHVRDPDSSKEILVELAETVRATFPDRTIHLTTEDNRNITRLHERAPDGRVPLYTGEWNDDLHNVAHVIATHETEGYYVDFADDRWTRYARALAEGFAYQGEPSPFQNGEGRGVPSRHLPPVAFVDFLQNHDQVGNRAFGERLDVLATPAMVEALTAILLLSPHIPLMFMGEEWGETRPFAFFTDFEGELADAVREGRRREFAGFAAFEEPAARETIPDPNAPGTFAASKIDWSRPETPEGGARLARTRRMLETRASEVVPLLRGAGGDAGKVLVAEDGALLVRWRLNGGTLTLRANLGVAPAALPAAPGRVIHTVGVDAAAPEAPPGSVVFAVDEA